ncbi:MAG: Hsp20/alpha crystallin family protein [Planctomycetota bacterium]|nr:MAG: Hsp20/alpha crystallin family protein [Planctomycetota bacterium]
MTLIPWKDKNREDAAGLPAAGFRNEMDRLFNSFFGESFGELGRPFGFAEWGPPLDVEETDKEVLVRAEIPGVKADELELSMSGNALVISGEKKESEERKEKGYHYRERRFGSFRREVPLPAAVDPEKVEAEYKDGVLHVKLHKAQEALPKKITVKSS